MRRLTLHRSHPIDGDVSDRELRALKEELESAITHTLDGEPNERVYAPAVDVSVMFGKLHLDIEVTGKESPPATRAGCAEVARPCPYQTCRYHLLAGSDQDRAKPDVSKESCVLDVAERGGVSFEEVASLMGMTRQRVQQIEAEVADKLRRSPVRLAMLEDVREAWHERSSPVAYDNPYDGLDDEFQRQVDVAYARMFPRRNRKMESRSVRGNDLLCTGTRQVIGHGGGECYRQNYRCFWTNLRVYNPPYRVDACQTNCQLQETM